MLLNAFTPYLINFENHYMKNAVLYIVFNRIEITKQSFEIIRRAKPPRLYIAADGPRESKTGESEKCEEVRRIATNIDWDCEVKTLFQDQNLGCRKGVITGINWFFNYEDQGIILEDDIIPKNDLNKYSEKLLELIQNREKREAFSKNGWGFVKEKFHYSRLVKDVETLYLKLLKK